MLFRDAACAAKRYVWPNISYQGHFVSLKTELGAPRSPGLVAGRIETGQMLTRIIPIRRMRGTGRHYATQSWSSAMNEEAMSVRRERVVRIANSYAQEAVAKSVVEEHISDSLEFRWLGEGTLADAVVRPSLHVDDSWIGV